ncbi:hypothetical protein MKW98_002151 [Papaver atlanticum]|uniref:Vps72/YL1 C-terminal domain-containing protein n=1 Tax=Papaver atlanticum TaxID=357466 RepID=A0AAD4X2R2_9MAGN|nr:hypothetical protein MKW98_002151 [Papaver atlanticum]
METSKEDGLNLLERASRATRGKRMTKLLDEELEEDELFWNQDALKEEEDDINYKEEGEDDADVFDSDFDEDEPEPDEEGANDADLREKPKKKLLPPGGKTLAKRMNLFPGKTLRKKTTKKKSLSQLEKSSDDEDEDSPRKQQTSPPEHHDVHDDIEGGERTVRKSTRTSVVVRQAEREAIRAAMQATTKPIKRKKEGEEKRMTQEEMLLEAAQTEIMNLRNLERVLAREEEVKKRAVVHKSVFSGPQTRYFSRDGQSFIEFNNGISFQSEICATTPSYPQKAVCAVTGFPAKYRDPKTGLPYATKEAFKIIRERFLKENTRENEKKGMDILLDSISGQGFSGKRKRSEVLNRGETSYLRYWARFRHIPALESQVLE